ncbi:hypothetical protein [Azohydromonas sediminis]|uniref:hypothetical protein n=1 Tax=Azohydromonas sediminis TaxID=2259674 RepID=UPI0013C2D1ED|nr:hypothetical protein [Azohydromonas sediminis]
MADRLRRLPARPIHALLRGVSTSSDSPHGVARAPGCGVVAGVLSALLVTARAAFARVTIVLRRIGRAAEREPVGFVGRVVRSWRYENKLCLWFRVTFGPDGRTIGGAGCQPDPLPPASELLSPR